MLIDTHSHIYAEEFDEDRDEAIARAEKAGIGMILLPAIDSESHDRQHRLAGSRPDLFREMMGLHPTSVDANYEENLKIAHNKLFNETERYIAVGEVGLDFYWDTTFRKEQCEALTRQMRWARKLEKPIVLHLRSGREDCAESDAYAEVFRLIDCFGETPPRGVMHCFSGTVEDALRAVELGFLIGIGGTLTYKKSTLPDVVRGIPIENIVLETDDPYLPPVPHRGQRNEPAYMVHVAEKVAELKGLSTDAVATITTNNARALFNL